MTVKNKSVRHIVVPVTEFKYDSATGEFSCYANVKGVIDHAQDRTVDGCFTDSIARHKANGTMPKMFWMHNPYGLPVGPWFEMREDEKGLFMRGKLSKTTMGMDIETLAKDKALDSFSIGYQVIEEKWNTALKCNDLIKVHVVEVSWVNFACNEESRLQEIKSHLEEGKLPTKAELREILDSVGWLSKRQIEKITGVYQPSVDDEEKELQELAELLAKSELFK